MTTGKQFVADLQKELKELFDQLDDRDTLESESDGEVDVVTLLKLALQSELEASELAALWMPSTPEIDAKRMLAHQCNDEMKHYELIVERLAGGPRGGSRAPGGGPQPVVPAPAVLEVHRRAHRRRPVHR